MCTPSVVSRDSAAGVDAGGAQVTSLGEEEGALRPRLPQIPEGEKAREMAMINSHLTSTSRDAKRDLTSLAQREK